MGNFLDKRNATEVNDFKEHSEHMFHQFLKRGYPKGVIQSAVTRATERDCNSLFEDKQQSTNKQLCVALDFTPQTNRVIEILKIHWHIISEIPGCDVFPQIGFKKMSSLRQILVKADSFTPSDMPSKNLKGHLQMWRLLDLSLSNGD